MSLPLDDRIMPEPDRPEPVNQPPNPAELREAPPATPECAHARSLMRDFADHDLSAVQVRQVENHVHDCRTCALALGRAEYEVFRVRSAFLASWAQLTPRPGFARRTVERLLAETATDRRLPPVAEPVPMAAPTAAVVAPRSPAFVRREPSSRRAMVTAMACCIAVALVVASFTWQTFSGQGGAALVSLVRLSISGATGGWHDAGADRHRLGAGDGLADGATVLVEADGLVTADFHDASPVGKQPGAALVIEGGSELHLADGVPQLLRGSMVFTSQRQMTLRIGQDVQVEIGAGEYRIEATEEASVFDRLDATRAPLAATVQVVVGESARVSRAGGEPATIGVGQIGRIGDGLRGVAIENMPSRSSPVASRIRPRDDDPSEAPSLVAVVLDQNQQPVADARVNLRFPTADGLIARLPLISDQRGRVEVAARSGPAAPYVLVDVSPPHSGLGLVVPDLRSIAADGANWQTMPIRLEPSARLQGVVLTTGGQPLDGAKVVLCLYDELFGLITPWLQRGVFTNGFGRFDLDGLPTRLPAHTSLGLLVTSAGCDLEFRPLPNPGSASSQAEVRVEVRSLNQITLLGVPSGQWEVLEELPLPVRGLGLRQHLANVGHDGRVTLAVGSGSLWLRSQGMNSADELRRIENTEHPGTRRVDDDSVPFADVFRPLSDMVVLATETSRHLQIVPTSRFDVLQRNPSGSTFTVLREGDGSASQASTEVQAFALQTVRSGGYRVRCIGLQAQNGVPFDFAAGESEYVALLGDSLARGRIDDIGSNGAASSVRLALPGSVTFAASRVPAGRELQVQFRARGNALVSRRPPLYRFISSGQLTVTDVPAGDYDIVDGLGHSGFVAVRAGANTQVP